MPELFTSLTKFGSTTVMDHCQISYDRLDFYYLVQETAVELIVLCAETDAKALAAEIGSESVLQVQRVLRNRDINHAGSLNYMIRKADFLYQAVEADVSMKGALLRQYLHDDSEPVRKLVADALSRFHKLKTEVIKLERAKRGRHWGGAIPFYNRDYRKGLEAFLKLNPKPRKAAKAA